MSQFAFIQPRFEEFALALFRHQAGHNKVYAEWLTNLGWDAARIAAVERVEDIPYLPIATFKQHAVTTGDFTPEVTFTSSGTTGSTPSQHHVASLETYLRNTEAIFSHFYAPPKDFAWLCLLPSYLEREGSSLVAMADHFIQQSPVEESGFFLKGFEELRYRLETLELNGVPTVLLGVTYGLLDFAEWLGKPMPLKHTIVMETGGMKGRRVEPTREEVHRQLKKAFGLPCIHSEYGMTELMSQAYSKGDGRFATPPHMAVLPRDLEMPLAPGPLERPAPLNIIDLANADTCAFIATEDLGTVFANGIFEVHGRMQGADLRGCNLMTL